MPGHMTAFRHTPDVAERFLQIPFLSSFDAFVGENVFSEAFGTPPMHLSIFKANVA